MIEPPTPFVPAILLTIASKLGYLITARDVAGRELGVLADRATPRSLVMANKGTPGTVTWTIVDTTPPGFMPFLLPRLTADVLRGGSLEDDGTVSFQGTRYIVRAWYDGVNMIAEATPA